MKYSKLPGSPENQSFFKQVKRRLFNRLRIFKIQPKFKKDLVSLQCYKIMAYVKFLSKKITKRVKQNKQKIAKKAIVRIKAQISNKKINIFMYV